MALPVTKLQKSFSDSIASPGSFAAVSMHLAHP